MAARGGDPRDYSDTMTKSKLTSIELFTGAGGLALGVARAGFHHVALVELNPDAVDSLNENRKRIREMNGWPKEITPTNVRDVQFKQYKGAVTLIAAGAPCQPFSLGGKHRGHRDERNLFPDVFKATREVRPEAVIVENVRGLLRQSFREYFDYIKLHLSYPALPPDEEEDWRSHRDRLREIDDRGDYRGLRYNVEHQLLNAANFGLPQRRERVFIVALRSDLRAEWKPIEGEYSEDALLYEQWVSGEYWEEHRMAKPDVPEKLRSRISELAAFKRSQIRTKRWRTVRDALRGLPEPAVGTEHPSVLNHVSNPGARQYPGHTGSPLDQPAKTLKAGDHGVPGGENMLVDDDGSVRYFTVREAARLQGFPDEYYFKGAWCEAFRQLGNAVPVTLAEVVASRVREIIESVHGARIAPVTRRNDQEALATSA